MLISKFRMSQCGQQKITIHVFSNISRSKGNQTMKFCHLIEYKVTNIFLNNHTQNVIEELVPDPFIKNLNYAYHWINNAKAAEITYTDCTSTS